MRLEELFEVLSDQNVRLRTFAAKESNTCKICRGTAVKFRSAATRLEYKISAICEKCQDYYYLDGKAEQ